MISHLFLLGAEKGPDPDWSQRAVLCRVRKDVIAWRTSTTWHDGPVRFALHWSRSGVLETAGADRPHGLAFSLSIC